MRVCDVPPDNFSGVQIHDRGKVDEFLFEGNVGEVRRPCVIGNTGARVFDVILEWSGCSPLISPFAPPAFAFVRMNVPEMHQALHPLFSNPKRECNPSIPIAWMVTERRHNLFSQKRISALSFWLVIPRSTHKSKHRGNKKHRKVGKFFSHQRKQLTPLFFSFPPTPV